MLQPSIKRRVTQEALTIQGRTLDEVMAHPLTQQEGKIEFAKILGRYVDKYDRLDKFLWGGQNPAFDMEFVKHLWSSHGDSYFGAWFYYHPLDLITMMVALRLRGYYTEMPNLKLGTICNALGVRLDNAHNALADVRATREAFYRAIDLMPQAPTS